MKPEQTVSGGPGGDGIFFTAEVTQKFRGAVYRNLSAPTRNLWAERNPCNARRVVSPPAQILKVNSVRHVPEIGNPVVGRIAVDVVNLQAGPPPEMNRPRRPMR